MDPVTIAMVGSGLLKGGLDWWNASNQADAERSAAKLQYQANQDAIAEQRRQYGQTRQDLSPYMGYGKEAGDKYMAGLMGGAYDAPAFDFKGVDMSQDPGVQYRMDQANKALQASAAARGGLMSGATMSALQKQNQALASQEYGNAYNRQYGQASDAYNRVYGARQDAGNRLAGLISGGQNAAAGLGSLGANAANQIGAFGVQGGAALAGGKRAASALDAKALEGLFGGVMGGAQDALMKYYGAQGGLK